MITMHGIKLVEPAEKFYAQDIQEASNAVTAALLSGETGQAEIVYLEYVLALLPEYYGGR